MRKEELENLAPTKDNKGHEKQKETANNLSLINFITEPERKMKREAAEKRGLLRAITGIFVFDCFAFYSLSNFSWLFKA